MKRPITVLFFAMIVVGIVAGVIAPSEDSIDKFNQRGTIGILQALARLLEERCGDPQAAFAEILKNDDALGMRSNFPGGNDSWGGKIVLRQYRDGRLTLTSSGADKKLGTSDDIVVEVKNKKC